MMRKRLGKMLAVMLMLSITACSGPKQGTAADSGNPEAARQNIVLKIGTTSSAKGMPSRSAAYFQKRIEELSGGTITCEQNIAGALGNTAQHYAQLKEGSLDVFVTAYDTFNVMESGDDFSVCVVPYVFNDIDHYMKWIDSDIYKEMVKKVEDANNVKVLGPVGKLASRGLSTTAVPVHSVNDVENLKIRCPETPSMTAVWEAWGANPVIIPASEIYTSLDGGICDGQDNDVITTNNSGYAEVQKYYMELNYIQQCAVLVMSGSTWNKLDETQRGWVEQAVGETLDGFSKELDGEYEAAKENMIGMNVEFIDVDIESFRSAASEAIKKMDGNLFSQGLYDRIHALGD